MILRTAKAFGATLTLFTDHAGFMILFEYPGYDMMNYYRSQEEAEDEWEDLITNVFPMCEIISFPKSVA